MQEREEPAQGEKGEQHILFVVIKISFFVDYFLFGHRFVNKKYVIMNYIYETLHAITNQI